MPWQAHLDPWVDGSVDRHPPTSQQQPSFFTILPFPPPSRSHAAPAPGFAPAAASLSHSTEQINPPWWRARDREGEPGQRAKERAATRKKGGLETVERETQTERKRALCEDGESKETENTEQVQYWPVSFPSEARQGLRVGYEERLKTLGPIFPFSQDRGILFCAGRRIKREGKDGRLFPSLSLGEGDGGPLVGVSEPGHDSGNTGLLLLSQRKWMLPVGNIRRGGRH